MVKNKGGVIFSITYNGLYKWAEGQYIRFIVEDEDTNEMITLPAITYPNTLFEWTDLEIGHTYHISGVEYDQFIESIKYPFTKFTYAGNTITLPISLTSRLYYAQIKLVSELYKSIELFYEYTTLNPTNPSDTVVVLGSIILKPGKYAILLMEGVYPNSTILIRKDSITGNIIHGYNADYNISDTVNITNQLIS